MMLNEQSSVANVVAMVQSAGLLRDVTSFNCQVSHGDEEEPGEWIGIKFVGRSPVPERFPYYFVDLTFGNDGGIEMFASPNLWSEYQMGCVLVAMSGECTGGIEKMFESLVTVISKTLSLYSMSVPMDDYEPLLKVWESLNPQLIDPGESPYNLRCIPESSEGEAKNLSPWWRFWH